MKYFRLDAPGRCHARAWHGSSPGGLPHVPLSATAPDPGSSPDPGSRRRLPTLTSIPLALALPSFLGGCTRAPDMALFGAVFPGWLFCLAAGVILTVLVHALCKATIGVDWLRPLPVSYVGLFALSSALTWLVFFYR